jgi:ribulose-phosphate 3-epimerase
MIVAPSLLAADFSDLKSELRRLDETEATWLHLDVMDNNFVPNLSFGPAVIKSIRPLSNLVFDVHLMINNVEKSFQDYIRAGADIITFHYEAATDISYSISAIKKTGTKAGISIKPSTSVDVLKPYLNDLDLILVMSVEPGFGGQSFMKNALPKMETLKKWKQDSGFHYLISVDGGINDQTSKLAAESGAEVVVAGTYLFHSDAMKQRVKDLKAL